MSLSANTKYRSAWESRLEEWSPIAAGLIGGLVMSAVLFRGGWSAEWSKHLPESPARVPAMPIIAPPAVVPPVAAPPVTKADRKVSLPKPRISDPEQKQIERRLAELEADTVRVKQAAVRMMPTRPHVSSGSAAEKNSTQATNAKSTQAYWNGLNDIISREGTMRTAPRKVTGENAGSFVDSRTQAGKFAAKALGELKTAGVDAEAIALGQELIAWYREEVTLSEQAKTLLGSADIAARKGTAGNAWRAAEDRHRRQCDEINRHAADLQVRLSRKYGVSLPKLN